MNIKKIRKIYNRPKDEAWLYLKRAGHRAELYQYYKPRMAYIRNLYDHKDYAMLKICLKELKDKSLYYANRGLGFAVNKELFLILTELLEFQGRYDYVKILKDKTTNDMFKEPVKENNIESK